ncbi:MAG: DUF4013 domain-containing protein [Chloroflexi bacterium]|nr:DUF4013 domain-containing protein [Chloroflexota bacterium]
MNDLQPILLFPVRDAFARKQFLFASLVMLAGMIIPILPMLVLMGYGARIMRQIIDEDKGPAMLEWQGSDWGELLKEGARIFAVRLVYILPILLFMGCGFIFIFASPFFFTPTSNGDVSAFAPLGGISMFVGFGIFMLATLLSLPLGIILGAAEAHTVTKQSFQAGLQVREWWPIFRNGIGTFLLAYAFTMVVSMIFSIVMQIAMITIVLICILPFLMVGFSAYMMLVMNALFAKAYATGRKTLQTV